MRIHRLLAIAVTISGLTSAGASADETMRLPGYGGSAATSTLKYYGDSQTDTVPVFHGRIAAGLLGCRRPVVYYAPVPVYQGCVGGFGGGYWPAPVPTVGYSVRPAPVFSSAPSYVYRAPAPTFKLPPSQAIVSLPRLGLTFSLGDDNGLTVGRSLVGKALSERPAPQHEMPSLPPIEPRSEQFQYDGGPSAPIPMPRSSRPLPQVDPRMAPAIDNRVKLSSPSPTWTAYGEKSKRIPNSSSLLVNQRGR